MPSLTPRRAAPVAKAPVIDGCLNEAAWLFDREAHLLVPVKKVRDGTLTSSNQFSFILDTHLDRQNGFVFATMPAGIEYDGQVAKEGEGGSVFRAGQTRALSGSMGGFNWVRPQSRSVVVKFARQVGGRYRGLGIGNYGEGGWIDPWRCPFN